MKNKLLLTLLLVSFSSFSISGCKETSETELRTETNTTGTSGSGTADSSSPDANPDNVQPNNENHSPGNTESNTGTGMQSGTTHSSNDPMMKIMNESMDKMKTMPMTGHPDQDFASMMIEHHRGAIDMANSVLKSGDSPEVKKLAENIVKTQTLEIKQLQTYVNKFKSTHKDDKPHKVDANDPFTRKMMASMKMDMSTMQHSSDPDLSFVSMMIEHHRQGVEMAKAELEHGKDAQIKKMAEKIISDQQKEIQTMQSWQEKNKA